MPRKAIPLLFPLLTAALLALVACREPAGGSASSAPSATATAATASAAATTHGGAPRASGSGAAQASGAAGHPALCEVEFFGQVKMPPDPGKQMPIVYAAVDDCLGPSPKIIGQTSTQADGKFFLEVFVKWASDLTLCAAHYTDPTKPTKLYGKAAGPFHAEATGEVEFKNVQIELKPGAARTFPKPNAAYGMP